MPSPIDAILIGAGDRGADTYGRWAIAHPDNLHITAVAEPLEERRTRAAAHHQIPAEKQFTGWREMLAKPRMARAAIIATQDQQHTAPAIAALEAGYDVLLEKPMAHRLEECVALVQAAERTGKMLQICHVLRYTDTFRKMYEIVQSGRLGQIVTVAHRENVSSWHMAHSYVRGNWRRVDESSPMMLAKCCHDLDMLYWLLGENPVRLSSTGTLTHFRAENAPPNAPKRCTDGCPAAETCPFYAPNLYIDLVPIKEALSQARSPLHKWAGRLALSAPGLLKALAGPIPTLRELTHYSGWPRSVITRSPSDDAAVMHALETGPYGRCVYHCDNDVVDHQVVLMEMESGVSVSHTMHGHSYEEGRTTRIDGSQATLLARFGFNQIFIEVRDHRGMLVERYDYPNAIEEGGHGGGDDGLMHAFVASLQEGAQTPMTTARASLESHLLAFAAEEARLEHTVIDMDAYREKAEKSGAAE